jgi:glycosyltransferase involved in cell wall biosynthesis
MFSRIIFWEPTVSPHKFSLFEAISQLLPNTEIFCMAAEPLSAERIRLGWTAPKPCGFRLQVAPSSQDVSLAIQATRDVLHVFSGIRHVPMIVYALHHIRSKGCSFGIMSEPRDRRGAAGLLRYVESWLTEGWLRERSSFVLAIGGDGPAWFRSVGYPAFKIFPFAYFLGGKVPAEFSLPIVREHSRIQLIYVGRLTKEKGVEDAIEVAEINPNVRLSIYGHGPSESAIRKRLSRSGSRITLEGSQPNEVVLRRLREADVALVLSTVKDGWGAVVTESLLSGTAVITTPPVGASVLMSHPVFGKVVAVRRPDLVSKALESLVSDGSLTSASRHRRAELASLLLTAERGARYFVEILDNVFSDSPSPRPFYMLSPEESAASN